MKCHIFAEYFSRREPAGRCRRQRQLFSCVVSPPALKRARRLMHRAPAGAGAFHQYRELKAKAPEKRVLGKPPAPQPGAGMWQVLGSFCAMMEI